MKKLILSMIAFLSFLFVPALLLPTSASTSSCVIIYGGGQACPEEVSFSMKKFVLVPSSTSFTENDLSINNAKFKPGDTVKFRIEIKNTGSKEVKNLEVVDTLPQFVNFVSGEGNFNNSTKKLIINVASISAGQTKTIDIVTKVADSSLLPQDKGTVCVINNAKATTSDGMEAQDSIQFCIEKKVLGAAPTPQVFETPEVTTIPTTGPELLPLGLLLAGGIAGTLMRRKSN